jgi:hypothetical protein
VVNLPVYREHDLPVGAGAGLRVSLARSPCHVGLAAWASDTGSGKYKSSRQPNLTTAGYVTTDRHGDRRDVTTDRDRRAVTVTVIIATDVTRPGGRPPAGSAQPGDRDTAPAVQ